MEKSRLDVNSCQVKIEAVEEQLLQEKETASDLLTSIDEIDGFLIGGASQSSKKFIDIIKNYYK